VDTLRGYFLVCITLDHFYNPLTRFTKYTFGYASSPDGFIFLSGLVSGWVYLAVADKYGPAAMRGRVFRRAGTIYLTHVALVTLCSLAVLWPGFEIQKMQHVWQTAAAGALLKNQVGFERILRLYCMFLACTPLVLRQFRAGRAWLVGVLSAISWVAAQCGLLEARASALNAHPVGVFSFFAMQAYFLAGLYLGYRGARFGDCGLGESRRLQIVCALVAGLLLIDRHLALLGRHPLFGFTGSPNQNPIRFLDAACLGYLLWSVPRTWDLQLMRAGFFRFCNFLGHHSLQVVAFSLLLTNFEKHAMAGASGEARLVVAVANVLSLWLPARIHELWREGALYRAPALPRRRIFQTSN
jgi:hypothetical protein